MTRRHYYLLSRLPHLGELGATPPLTVAELLAQVEADSPTARALTAVVLAFDLQQRESLLAGQTEEFDLAVLDEAQVRGEAPLPEFLAAGEGGEASSIDQLWAAYYRYAAGVAAETDNPLLRAWVGYEVALRNALVEARAKALGIDVERSLVARDLAEDYVFTEVINEWSGAENPFVGLQMLERRRWQWLSEHEDWFSFSDAELTVYALRLLMLHRYQRLEKAVAELAK